jgi:hypothetical protein
LWVPVISESEHYPFENYRRPTAKGGNGRLKGIPRYFQGISKPTGAGGEKKIPRTRKGRARLRLTYIKFERFSAACLAAAERVPSPACSRRSTSLQISLKFSLRAIFSMLCPGRNRVVHAAFPESYRPPDHLGIGRKSRQSLPGRRHPAEIRHWARAAYRQCADQMRIVSVARIRLDSHKSMRAFKGIICDDISEFESYEPSQAVRSLCTRH